MNLPHLVIDVCDTYIKTYQKEKYGMFSLHAEEGVNRAKTLKQFINIILNKKDESHAKMGTTKIECAHDFINDYVYSNLKEKCLKNIVIGATINTTNDVNKFLSTSLKLLHGGKSRSESLR